MDNDPAPAARTMVFFLVFALALDGFFNLLASQLFATALYLNVAYIPQNFIREIGVW